MHKIMEENIYGMKWHPNFSLTTLPKVHFDASVLIQFLKYDRYCIKTVTHVIFIGQNSSLYMVILQNMVNSKSRYKT